MHIPDGAEGLSITDDATNHSLNLMLVLLSDRCGELLLHSCKLIDKLPIPADTGCNILGEMNNEIVPLPQLRLEPDIALPQHMYLQCIWLKSTEQQEQINYVPHLTPWTYGCL